jgi:ABC-2 type transport system permease protein|tara:strand:+ start:4425 stop:5807 length:1383 start_codon:yes stop_codon:yes gene_type:complete
MKHLLFNEYQRVFRNNLFIVLISIFAISLILTTYFGVVHNKKQIVAQKEAQEHVREQWDERTHGNPHQSAHFGSYAFKPSNILNSIDEGVNSVTGNVIRLEGHRQNEVMFSEASQSLQISTFGKLKPSLLLQFLIPLLLIFLSFSSYTQERDSGRLKLLLVQGASLQNILFSKIISVWLIGLALLLLTILVQIIFNISYLNLDTIFRLTFFLLSYSLYYFILISLTILFSVVFKNNTGALSLTVVVWVLWVIFLPKTIGNTVEKFQPLPTRIEFQNQMKNDRSKGLDGHNPSDERQEALIQETLIKYGVDNLAELPVNFRGILMQADEEYGNSVWDKHFGALYATLQIQKNIYQFSGLVNPFASLQSLSMGTAGTDMFHHLNFLRQAEDYRRELIKNLNNKWRDGGWDEVFFQSIKEFEYKVPNFLTLISKYFLDILFLCLWPIILFFVIQFLSKKTTIL